MGAGGFGRTALPFAFLLVFFAAVMLLLGSVFAGLVGGIVAAVVGTGALVLVLCVKFDRMKRGTVVRFSEYGLELSYTKGFRVTQYWPDLTQGQRVVLPNAPAWVHQNLAAQPRNPYDGRPLVAIPLGGAPGYPPAGHPYPPR